MSGRNALIGDRKAFYDHPAGHRRLLLFGGKR
jgi:hypothetical protein